MEIFFGNEQNFIEDINLYEGAVQNAVAEVLKGENILDLSHIEISVTFVDNEKIRELNKLYREKDQETDVLSFPQYDNLEDLKEDLELKEQEESEQKESEQLLDEVVCLGDIVISVEKAIQQSEEFGHSLEREIMYLLVHSLYHLIGYDHIDGEDKKIMRKREEQTMTLLGVTRE